MRYLKIFAVCLIIICVGACSASSQTKNKTASVAKQNGIEFIEDDWNSALKKAGEQNKLVFIDIYATWCGPCKMLKQYTFTDASVSSFFNSNFINVSVDGEKGVGPQLAQQYSIEGYPTLIITDAKGKPVLYTAGYMQPSDLLKFANAALKKKSD